jgi:hypothetical protein
MRIAWFEALATQQSGRTTAQATHVLSYATSGAPRFLLRVQVEFLPKLGELVDAVDADPREEPITRIAMSAVKA